jgi:retron-type reverse transcriptase
MYTSCRRGTGAAAGARAGQAPVGAHAGAAADFLRRHEREANAAVRGNKETRERFLADLLPRTADTRNLRAAWDYLAGNGGQAPGPDGLCYDDPDDKEVWALLRRVGTALRDGTYRPGPDRKVQIPKSSGQGTRTLLLPSVIDRVVPRAVVQTVQPYLDPQFDDNSFGFRPGRDRQRALARAATLASGSGSWVWVTEDIRDAFNQMPLRRLLDVVRLRLPDPGIVRLIERLVLTEAGRGLRQGGCLSPLLLNLYLDHHLDRKWRSCHPNLPLLRVADDLLALTRSGEEARQAWNDLQEALRPVGMPLKGSPSSAVRDLSGGDQADWLGFRLARGEGGLEVRPAARSWRQLTDHLAVAHTRPNLPLLVVEVIVRWAEQLGPCYPWTDPWEAYARVAAIARELAFEEIPPREEFLGRWRRAFGRWQRIRAGTT